MAVAATKPSQLANVSESNEVGTEFPDGIGEQYREQRATQTAAFGVLQWNTNWQCSFIESCSTAANDWILHKMADENIDFFSGISVNNLPQVKDTDLGIISNICNNTGFWNYATVIYNMTKWELVDGGLGKKRDNGWCMWNVDSRPYVQAKFKPKGEAALGGDTTMTSLVVVAADIPRWRRTEGGIFDPLCQTDGLLFAGDTNRGDIVSNQDILNMLRQSGLKGSDDIITDSPTNEPTCCSDNDVKDVNNMVANFDRVFTTLAGFQQNQVVTVLPVPDPVSKFREVLPRHGEFHKPVQIFFQREK